MAPCKLVAAAISAAALARVAIAGPLPPTNLRVEYLPDPRLIDTPTPRFSWEARHTDRGQAQSAYRLVVSNAVSGAVAFDSGKTSSASTAQVTAGPFAADSRYTWAVQWWDAAGVAAPWPAVNGTFATGTFGDAMWTAAGSQWIGCADQGNNVTNGGSQLRYEFAIPAPKTPGATLTQARLYVTGLGWHVAFFNGQRLGESIFAPAFTGLRQRVLYEAHDVTRELAGASGASTAVFAAYLGHGWPEVITPWADNGSGDPAWNGSGTAAGSTGARMLVDREGLMGLTEEDIAPLRSGHTGYQRRLRLLLSLKFSDGSNATVVSSAANMGATASASAAAAAATGQWMCGAGALAFDNLYDGTTYDASLETSGWLTQGYAYNTPSAGAWSPAVRIAEPGGRMVGEAMEGVQVMESFAPKAMWESTPGSFVFDLGQNAAGAVLIRLPTDGTVAPGTVITVRHAEAVLHPPYGPQNGSLYYGNLRSAKATDTYVTSGRTADAALLPQPWWDALVVAGGYEAYFPLFTWHGFRYVEVSGLPFTPSVDGTTVTGLHFRSSVDTTGSIAFPDSAFVLNQLQHAVQWGQASNLMMNPSDCPQRDERLGWTGDSALTAEEATLNFGMGAFYTNWAASLYDAFTNTFDPTFKPGTLPSVVPDVTGGYGNDLSWESVYPSVVFSTFKAYNDTAIAAAHWAPLLQYANTSYSLIMSGGSVSTWGDWCPPPAQLGGGQGPKPPAHFTALASFLNDMNGLIEIGEALGDAANTVRLANMRAAVVANFRSQYWNAAGGYYGPSPTDGLQTAQACALGVGGVVQPSEAPVVVSTLVKDIVDIHAGHSSVGIIGQKFVTRALTAAGYSALAINMTLQTDYPSFGWAFNHPIEPATTLWELWDGPAEGPGMNSRNHIMQGAIGAWLYTDVLGLDQQPGTQGYTTLLVWPRTTDHPALPYASGSLASIRGPISVRWANATNGTGMGGPGSFQLDVTVPVGSVAELRIPYNAGTALNALVGTEGTGSKAFWTAGAFVPGAVAGVTFAEPFAAGQGSALPGLRVLVGSGSYAFTLSW